MIKYNFLTCTQPLGLLSIVKTLLVEIDQLLVGEQSTRASEHAHLPASCLFPPPLLLPEPSLEIPVIADIEQNPHSEETSDS